MWDTFCRNSAYIQITLVTCQNSLSEHSFEGVPASLYNLTKSVLDT